MSNGSLNQLIKRIAKRPGMYVHAVSFDTILAFLEGFGTACGPGALKPIEGWVREKLNITGEALALSGMVKLAVDQNYPNSSEEERVAYLLSILAEYASENVDEL